KIAAQHLLDPFAALEAEVAKLIAEEDEGRRPGLHAIKRLRRKARLLDRRLESGALAGRDALDERREAARESQAGHCRHQLAGVLLIDDRFDDQLLRPGDGLVEPG